MKQLYSLAFRAVIALCFLLPAVGNAQTPDFVVTYCSGLPGLGTNTYGPMYSSATANSTSRTAFIYQASELTGISGEDIGSLFFNRYTTSGTIAGPASFKIYLKEVSNSDFGAGALDWATATSGATLVFDGNPAPIAGSSDGWKEFPFIAPFSYSGNGNLAVFTEYKNTNASTAITWNYEYTAPCLSTTNNNTTKYTNNTTGTLPASLSTGNYRRPYIAFDISTPCTTPPTPGDAVLDSGSTCTGKTVKLDVKNGSSGVGQTYVWQTASSGSGPWTDVSTASSASSFRFTVSGGTWYRAAVTCGGNTAYSTPLEVKPLATLPADDYTINAGQPTGGKNFNSISDVANALGCGIAGKVTFTFAPGTIISQRIEIPAIQGASAANTVTFFGNGTQIVHVANNSTERAAIVLNGAKHVIIDSFDVDASGGLFGWGIVLMNGADSNIIRNSKITTNITETSTNYAGIVINGSATGTAASGANGSGNLIENNHIIGGYYGIYAYGSTTSYNKNNVIRNNKIEDFYYSSIYVYGQESALIKGNDLSRPVRTNAGAYNLYAASSNGGVVFDGNISHNLFASGGTASCYGIYLASGTAAKKNLVINNLLYNINTTGTIYGVYGTSLSYVGIYHNTVVIDDQTATAGLTYGMYVYGTTDLNVKNNIIYVNRSGTSAKYNLYFSSTGVTSSNYNVLYMGSTTGSTNAIGYMSSAKTTLSDWQGAGFDANSVALDPMFNGSGDYVPNDLSLNNIGESGLGVTYDITGATRDNPPDPGAYEFSIAGTDASISIVSPVMPATKGLQPVVVSISNTGTTPISSVNISFTDGIVLNSQSFTGLNLAPGTAQNLTFTTQYNVQGITRLTAYINMVNGTPDLSQGNDTSHVSLCFAMKGNYVINQFAIEGDTTFSSFSSFVAALLCGGVEGKVTARVEPGTGPYNERVVIPAIPGATANSPVIIKGNNETIHFNSTVSAERSAIVLDGADHITIDSLYIDVSGGTYGWGILLKGGADSNTIRNNYITTDISSTATNFAGIVSSGSETSATTAGINASGNLIENNIVVGGYYGISLYGSTTDYNLNNIIRNNKVEDFYYYSIYFYGQKDGIVSKNDVSRPSRTNNSSYNIYLSTNGGGNLIEKNKVHNPFGNGTGTTLYSIYLNKGAAGSPNTVANNLIYDITGSNGSLYGIYGTTLDYVNVYHNTIVFDDGASTGGAVYGIYVYGSNELNVKNNIVYISRGGTGTKYNLYYSSTGVTSSNNNVLWNVSTQGTNNIGYFSSAKATFADWQATGYDQNSLNTDPMFIGGGDYTPTNPAVNNTGATGLNITTDINDVTRAAFPDPGAYEFNVTGVDAGISWVSPVTPATMGANPIKVKISNTATAQITSLNLSYTDGLTVETQNFTGLNIAPGTSTDLTFTTPYNITSNTTLTAYINLVNNTVDLSQANDTASASICFALKGNYTINQGGTPGGTNFMSFNELASALNCGGIDSAVVVTVVPGSGPYNERVEFDTIRGSSATNTVTIKGSLEYLNYTAAGSNDRAALVLKGTDFMIIDSLNIDVSAGSYGWGIVLTKGADSNIIRNSNILSDAASTSANYAGIVINGTATGTASSGSNGSGNIIENNLIKGGYYGVYLYGSTTAYNENNIVRNNTIEDYYYYGVYVYGQKGSVISKNNLSRPTRTNASAYNLYLSTNGGNNIIEKNTLRKPFGNNSVTTGFYGIYLNAGVNGSPNKVLNNLIYDIHGSSSGLQYGLYGLSANYTDIYHNTVVLDDASSTGGTTYGMYVYGTAIDLKNNIVYISRGGNGSKYALYFSATGVTSSDNNILYVSSTAGTSGVGYWNTGSTTLSDWQTAHPGHDNNSVSVDPIFSNPSTGEFIPTLSALNNLGTPVGVLTDIRDSARSTVTPDIGAFEYTILTPGLNLMADMIVSPMESDANCYTESETIKIKIRNSSTTAINFANNAAVLTVDVSGPVTQSFTQTINTGTLDSDSTLVVSIPTSVNWSAPGVYTLTAYIQVTGDVNPNNDTISRAFVRDAVFAGTISGPTVMCSDATEGPSLSIKNYSALQYLQWYAAAAASGPYTAIAGADSTSVKIAAPISQQTFYMAVASCGLQRDSAYFTVNYSNPQIISAADVERCGPGSVTLTATVAAGLDVNWYATPTSTQKLFTGSSFTTPAISASTTYYVSAATSGGGGSTSPLLITEMDIGTNDALEIQNVSPLPVDVTGWKVYVNGSSYTNINLVNANVQTLNGVMNPGDILTWTDQSGQPNYWGSNIQWNPGAYPTFTGWAAIVDQNGVLRDMVFMNWTASDIAASAISLGGVTINPSTVWSGDGVNITTVAATQSVSRKGTKANGNASDFVIEPLSVGTTNPQMSLPFSGFGCEGPRVAVTATVNAAGNTAGATGTTECVTTAVNGLTEFNFTDCDPIAVINPAGAAPVSGNVTTCVTVDLGVQTAPATGEPYVQRHYNITPVSAPQTATSNITLYFKQQEFDSFNLVRGTLPALPSSASDVVGIANLRVTQFNGTGTAPGNYTGTAIFIDPVDQNIVWNAARSRWEVTFSVTGSGGFYVHTGQFALPVRLIAFSGENAGGINKLKWTTSSEQNSAGFGVEKSEDGTHFKQIGYVQTLSEGGYSNQSLHYAFNDETPGYGKNFYRLKMMNKDQSFSYSKTIQLVSNRKLIVMNKLYPNPAVADVKIEVESLQKETVEVMVMDLQGRTVMANQKMDLTPGTNTKTLHVGSLSAGTYLVKIVCTDGCENSVFKFVKQ